MLADVKEEVRSKALDYMRESGEEMQIFPSALVDFVFDYAVENCHFPNHYAEEDMAARLKRCVGVIAWACSVVYAKSGAEGEIQHSENGVVRIWDKQMIPDSLLAALPNYVNTPSTLRI